MTERLPAHLEVGALIRAVESAGGFAAVLNRGERDAGTIVIVLAQNGGDQRVYERMPDPSGNRKWTLNFKEDIDNSRILTEYLDRRKRQDPDLWIVELDIANGERFIGLTDAAD